MYYSQTKSITLFFYSCQLQYLNASTWRAKDFMTAPIISEAVFNTMDKNKDGYVSKGKNT